MQDNSEYDFAAASEAVEGRRVVRASKALRKRLAREGCPFDEGDVLRFVAQYEPEGTAYTYAAIYVAGYWWLTGQTSGSVGATAGRRLTWENLVRFLASGSVVSVESADRWTQVR